MGDLADVVSGMVTTIKAAMTGDALAGRTFGFAPDSPDPPFCVVVPSPEDAISFDDDFDGTEHTFNLVVKVAVAAQVDRTSALQLLNYLDSTGTTSIRAAINSDRTLNSKCADLHVTSVSGYGDVEWAGQVFYGADIHVEVLT